MKSRRMGFAISFLVFSGTFCFALTTLPENARASTLFVGGTGPANYTKISSAMQDANPGDTVFVYSGTYVEQVTIEESISLVGENKDTTLINSTEFDTVKVRADQVTITGFTISGGGEETYDAGLDLEWSQDCHIIGNNFFWTNHVGVRLQESHNNHIENNVFSFSGYAGIKLRASDQNAFSNNVFSNLIHGLHLYWSSGNTISDNTISSNNDFGSGVRMGWSSLGNIITNNTITDAWWGMDLYYSNGTYLANNSISNTYYGIDVGRSANVTIVNNKLESNIIGIRLVFSTHNSLRENQMIGNGIVIESGYIEDWTTHTIDATNTANGKPVYYLKDTSGEHISAGVGQVIIANSSQIWVENLAITNTSSGIQVGFSSNVYILNSTVSGNTWNGIDTQSLKHSYINDNIVMSNGQCGIYVRSSDENEISRNYISDNQNIGIILSGGEDNMVFHNTIVENGDQGVSVGAANHWDNGYPSGGNYWSDYAGSDRYKGEDQNQLGSDGIGDEPHQLEGDISIDRYPLMSPFATPLAPPGVEPPVCDINTPLPDSRLRGIVTINGTASDPNGVVEKVEVRIGNNAWVEAEGTNAWTCQIDTNLYPDGEYTIHARSFDGLHFSEEVSVSVTVENAPTEEPIGIWLWAMIGVTFITVLVVLLAFFAWSKRRKHMEEESIDEPSEEESEN